MRMEEDFVPHFLVTSLEPHASCMLSKFLLDLGAASSHSLETLILHQPDTFKTQNYLINPKRYPNRYCIVPYRIISSDIISKKLEHSTNGSQRNTNFGDLHGPQPTDSADSICSCGDLELQKSGDLLPRGSRSESCQV